MMKLAMKYMRYYKNQTLAIWLSIFLTAILLSGVSSLLYSSDMNELENRRTLYGDWHYCVSGCEDIENGDNIVKVGRAELRDVITEPYFIRFINTDETCRQMLQREIARRFKEIRLESSRSEGWSLYQQSRERLEHNLLGHVDIADVAMDIELHRIAMSLH